MARYFSQSLLFVYVAVPTQTRKLNLDNFVLVALIVMF